MSEFKYACPVCGQHMICDVSQAGAVMECPTCFQKITVPQAPATADAKFIITGTKVGERPAPKFTGAGSDFIHAKKGFQGALVVALILIFIGVAVAFVYHGTIFKPKSTAEESNRSPAKMQKPQKPALVAPPANDADWMLNLDAVTIPDSTAAGRIHGRDFIVERAFFQDGILTLRGTSNLDATINFSGAQAETLAEQSINVTTNAETAAHLTLRWKEGNRTSRGDFANGYAMRLEFDPPAKNRLRGKIYLCAPDESKSYIAGTFNAQIRKPKAPKPKQ